MKGTNNHTKPIKDIKILDRLLSYLEANYPPLKLMFDIGLRYPISVVDMRKLKVKDVQDTLTFSVEGQTYTVNLDEVVKSSVKKQLTYISKFVEVTPDTYLFTTKQKSRMSRHTVNHELRRASEALGIPHMTGIVILKTWGYHLYQRTRNLGELERYFGSTRSKVLRAFFDLDVMDEDKDSTLDVINNINKRHEQELNLLMQRMTKEKADEINRMQKMIDDVTKDYAEYMEKTTKLKGRISNNFERLNSDIKGYQDKIQRLISQIGAMRAENKKLNHLVSCKEKEIKSISDSFININTEKYEKRISKLSEENENLTERLRDLKDKLSDIKAAKKQKVTKTEAFLKNYINSGATRHRDFALVALNPDN